MDFGIAFGAIMLALSVAFIVYGYLLYTRRLNLNRGKAHAEFARVAGRQAVAFGIVVALLAALVLTDLMVLLPTWLTVPTYFALVVLMAVMTRRHRRLLRRGSDPN